MALLEDYRVRLRRYDDELKAFEQRFGMTSAILFEKFEAGEVAMRWITLSGLACTNCGRT